MPNNEEIYLQVEGHFDAAHNLVNYNGKCANLHGHRWKVFIELGPFNEDDLDASGIAYDFKDIKLYLKELLDLFDHEYLNNFFDRPSAELIALRLYRDLRKSFDNVYSLELYESPESRCRVGRHGA